MGKDIAGKTLEAALEAIARLRRDGAKLHTITNSVAQNFTANVLLACNVTPSMTVSADECADFTARSDGLLINLGTLDAPRRAAIAASLIAAREKNIPFVLDPVLCHISPLRAEYAGQLLDHSPTILRANADESKALAAKTSGKKIPCLVQTGPVDIISGETEKWRTENGHPLMAKVIATGCAQGALMAALLAHAGHPAIAAIAASLWFGVAGEIAAKSTNGPGSFSPAFIDALYRTSVKTIGQMGRVSMVQ